MYQFFNLRIVVLDLALTTLMQVDLTQKLC